MKAQFLLYSLVFLAIPAHAQIYKCTDAQGKVNFTDSPCHAAGTARVETIQNVPPQGLDKITNDLKESEQNRGAREVAEAVKDRERETKANEKYYARTSHKGLRLGMTADNVQGISWWGMPDDRNVTETAYGKREQWIYQTSDTDEYRRMYLYFQNDHLIIIQD